MNRYDPEIVQLLAERGGIGGRIIRGLLFGVPFVIAISFGLFWAMRAF